MADREFEERFEETWNDVSDIEFLRLCAALNEAVLFFCYFDLLKKITTSTLAAHLEASICRSFKLRIY